MTKRDLTSHEDVIQMVNTFYAKVNSDELLSPIFNTISQVKWQQHLPKMYGFWNTLIFGDVSYKGNPFAAHLHLPIEEKHFDRWVFLFDKTITELFEGPIANHTITRATSIAHVFQTKLKSFQK